MTRHLTLKELLLNGAVLHAISYRRVSSERQLSGLGLERQRENTLAWIAKHSNLHIVLDDELEDAARSAWKGDHVKDGSALGSMLEQVKNGKLQPPLLVIVEALDRLSRQHPTVAAEQLTGLINRGVFIATTADDKIYGPGMDLAELILSVVYMAGAHAESENKSKRISATKVRRAKEAMVTKQVLHQNTPGWITTDKITDANRMTRKYELLRDHAATVLLIYKLSLHHGYSYIARYLIENKVQPFGGRTPKWTVRSVARILKSRAPIGHLVSKQGIIEDAYPRVPGVTDKLWWDSQTAQKARNQAGSQPWKTDKINLLKGIGKCECCGSPMRLTYNERTGYRYYGCRDRAHLGATHCSSTGRYRVDVIERAMLDDFGLGWLQAAPSDEPTVNLPKLEADLIKHGKRQKELEVAMQDPDEDLSTVRKALAGVRGTISDLQTQINAAKQQAALAGPTRIGDITDRPALAAALKKVLTRASFGPDSRVTLESGSHRLTLTARQDAPKPELAVLSKGKPMQAIRVGGKPVTIKALRRKGGA